MTKISLKIEVLFLKISPKFTLSCRPPEMLPSRAQALFGKLIWGMNRVLCNVANLEFLVLEFKRATKFHWKIIKQNSVLK